MKYSVFLFSQFFMLTTSFPNQVWIINKNSQIKELSYDLNTPVDHKQVYIFTRAEVLYGSIIYLVGAQTKPYQKVHAGTSAGSILKKIYEKVPKGFNLYFHRIMSDSTINSFADVQKWENVFEKIPRLYRVTDIVVQIPLKTELVDNVNAFVLHDGSAATMYYSSSTNEKTRNFVKSFVEYIVTFEKEKHNIDTPVSELYDKEESKTALDEFFKKIKEIMKPLSESETNSLQKNDVKNNETINKRFNAKINIAYDEEDEKFETFTKDILKYFDENLSKGRTDSIDYERVLSSLTASTSASSTSSASTTASTSKARKKEVLNRKTIRKEKKKSFRESKSANVHATPIPSFMLKSSVMTFGPQKCKTEGKTLLESIKSICVYIRFNFENSELFIYFGRDGITDQYQVAILIAELYLGVYPSMKVSYIPDDGNLLPPPFII